MVTRCYLALGSNIKSPERQLRQALNALKGLPQTDIIEIASIFRSKAWGRKGLPDYYNTVVAIQTSLKPKTLLSLCQKIENKKGRVRKLRWGSRTLDIDILIYGDLKINRPSLSIPHPRMRERDFVTVPLRELSNFY